MGWFHCICIIITIIAFSIWIRSCMVDDYIKLHKRMCDMEKLLKYIIERMDER